MLALRRSAPPVDVDLPQARLLPPNKRARNISQNDDAPSVGGAAETHCSIGATMVLLAS
jgi:hypothetical protein